MNNHMVTQINQILLSIQVFEESLKIAAQKDDGIISKEESKVIKKIEKASTKYKNKLIKIREET